MLAKNRKLVTTVAVASLLTMVSFGPSMMARSVEAPLPWSAAVHAVDAASTSIQVGVQNSSQSSKRWIVRDRKTGNVILDAVFQGKETKWISVSSTNGKSGDIQYRHANRSYWSGKSVTAGKVHDLY